MSIETIEVKMHKTSDGRIFENQKSAELWEEIISKRINFFERFQVREFHYAFWKPEPLYWLQINNVEDDKKYIEEKYKITSGLDNMRKGWNVITMLGSEEISFLSVELIIEMAKEIDFFLKPL